MHFKKIFFSVILFLIIIVLFSNNYIGWVKISENEILSVQAEINYYVPLLNCNSGENEQIHNY